MPDLMTPLDGLPWSSERFLRQAPTWAPSGVIGPVATAYGSGDMALSFAVSGGVVTVQMGTGRANCRGVLYERTASQWTSGATGTQPTPGTAAYALNTGSNPRIDRLVLRRNAGTQQVYPFIIQGTPASSPAKPALTQVEAGTWDIPMFSWQLAGSSSTSISNIVDERRWVLPDGSTGPRHGFELYRTTGTISDSSLEGQGFTSAQIVTDTDGYWISPTTNIISIPAGLGGLYHVSIGLLINGDTIGKLLLNLYSNIGPGLTAQTQTANTAWNSRVMRLVPGQLLALNAYQDSGNASNNKTVLGCHLSAWLIST